MGGESRRGCLFPTPLTATRRDFPYIPTFLSPSYHSLLVSEGKRLIRLMNVGKRAGLAEPALSSPTLPFYLGARCRKHSLRSDFSCFKYTWPGLLVRRDQSPCGAASGCGVVSVPRWIDKFNSGVQY